MKMIDKNEKKLSISKQAELLNINRTSLYYKPVPVKNEEYKIKGIIDEIYTAHPEYYRRITIILRRDYGFILIVKEHSVICRRCAFTGFVLVPTSVSEYTVNMFIRTF